jgi:hypothetical protein
MNENLEIAIELRKKPIQNIVSIEIRLFVFVVVFVVNCNRYRRINY